MVMASLLQSQHKAAVLEWLSAAAAEGPNVSKSVLALVAAGTT